VPQCATAPDRTNPPGSGNKMRASVISVSRFTVSVSGFTSTMEAAPALKATPAAAIRIGAVTLQRLNRAESSTQTRTQLSAITTP
jgi:hypothetical protein